MSEDRIESVIAQGVNRIALPPEAEWFPAASRRRGRVSSWLLFASVAVAVVVLTAALLGSGLRTIRETPASQPPATHVPGILPSATPDPTRGPDASWQQLRRSLPGVPMIEPTWLPPVFDGVQSGMSAFSSSNSSDTSYGVSYTAGKDTVVFRLRGSTALNQTPPPTVGSQSGFGGIVVRRSPAQLNFPSDLFADPRAEGLRVVRWKEGDYTLSIESQTISGDDLLRIAWSLDQTGAPGAPAVRTRPGACADTASAEATIRQLIALVGNHDRGALADCFAAEAVEYADSWADLPAAVLNSIAPSQSVGGRQQFQVSWTFATDPGGPWNIRATYFFLIAREDGRWRVFAVNSAPFPKAP